MILMAVTLGLAGVFWYKYVFLCESTRLTSPGDQPRALVQAGQVDTVAATERLKISA